MLLVAVSGAACGGAAQWDRLETSGRRHQVMQSIWTAEQAGAQQDPRSARLLQLARRQMMDAEATADNGDARNAALLYDRAEVDSRLALQVARTNAERENARRAWREFGAARQEL
jgi:hypothetical protein